MQLFIKTLTGRLMTINAEPTNTIEQIKMIIQQQEGLNAEDIRLIFAGKSLQDGRQCGMYGIQRQSTLHCVMRLQG